MVKKNNRKRKKKKSNSTPGFSSYHIYIPSLNKYVVSVSEKSYELTNKISRVTYYSREICIRKARLLRRKMNLSLVMKKGEETILNFPRVKFASPFDMTRY